MEFRSDLLKGRSFIVYGLGASGIAAAKRLSELGGFVQAWDDKGADACKSLKGNQNLKLSGDFDYSQFESVILSPGIADTGSTAPKIVTDAKKNGLSIISDVEMLFEIVRLSGSKARFASITGTNGKSTTTALLAHLLDSAGIPSCAGANLGPAALGLPLLPDDGVYVLELSSYTLERLKTYNSETAIWLNFTPDHLQRHGNLEGYHAAKAHIFDRMKPNSLAVLGTWGWSKQLTEKLLKQSIQVKILGENKISDDLLESPYLKGPHNKENIEACYWCAKHFGLNDENFKQGLDSFKGLEHRLEIIGKAGSILFVNDSKATNAEATIPALRSFNDIYLILGGLAKAGDILALKEHLEHVKHIFLIGEASDVFAKRLESFGFKNFEYCQTIDKALESAAKHAKIAGTGTVMLSPACASQDQFKNFEERGQAFKSLAQAYINLERKPL